MKDLFFAIILVALVIGLIAAVPVFGIVAGIGLAILFLFYVIQMDDDSGESE